MRIKDLKIGIRLRITMFIILLFSALTTVEAIRNLSSVAESTNVMLAADEKQSLTKDWITGTTANAIRTYAKAKSQNSGDEEYFTKEMEIQSKKINAIQKDIEKMLVDGEEARLFEVISKRRKEYIDIRNNIFKIKNEQGEAGLDTVAQLVSSKFVPSMNAYLESMQVFSDLQKQNFKKSHETVLSNADSSERTMIAIGIVALIVSLILAWLLSRSITRPLVYAVGVAKKVASGDLTGDVMVDSKDEAGELLLALKEMNGSLAKIVGQVRSGTDLISAGSTEIAAGTLDLSSRTEQQAASLEETASSMEELTSTVQQNADNARQAKQLANAASKIAVEGGQVVSKVVETMNDINESSRKIVDIISVIDGIAFQTNILALNAAVEAARAGEQGRGFAVVASEVRSLAQRSAAAAKEIKQLINASVEKVDIGGTLVVEAGSTMSQVVESVNRVTDIMAEISAASQEQASGIEQVNIAITKMDEVTQQNSSLVEEASAASQSMQNEALKLSEVVGIFKISGLDVGQVAPATPVKISKSVNFREPILQRDAQSSISMKIPALSSDPKRNSEWEEF